MSGGPGCPVPPSPGLVSRTRISYSVSGSRCQSLYVGALTAWVSVQVPDVILYSTSFRIMGPSPMMELAFSWMSKYVGPTPSSCGGAIGRGGSAGETKKEPAIKQKLENPPERRAFYTESCHSLVSKDSKPQKQIQTDVNEEELRRIPEDGNEWCTTSICSMYFFPFKNLS